VRRTLEARDDHPLDGNVVLLHDGGGDRAATLAALGPMIDSLRARGDTLLLLSELTGVSRDAAMPPLPPGRQFTRLVQLGAFATAATLGWAIHATLLAAVVLGVARVLAVLALAAWQQRRQRQEAREQRSRGRRRRGPRPRPRRARLPAVSVVVPAYNEERVIAKTIASLLEQRYDGPLEIVVVDDGSPDDTHGVAARAYGAHPQVAVYRKPNGGKASALNFGIARARGTIVVGMDADTVFLADTVAELVRPFADERVGAVAGNAKVGNLVNLVTRWQAVEYVTSQNLDRRAFALLDCITVVPGAVGRGGATWCARPAGSATTRWPRTRT
jgi:cellulose synthase/poly-beta-1,6-N-acetylglucosamine synthase-like glycosyltransferase